MIRKLESHTGAVNSVRISSNEKYIVSGSSDNSIKIWNFESGNLISTIAAHNKGDNSSNKSRL